MLGIQAVGPVWSAHHVSLQTHVIHSNIFFFFRWTTLQTWYCLKSSAWCHNEILTQISKQFWLPEVASFVNGAINAMSQLWDKNCVLWTTRKHFYQAVVPSFICAWWMCVHQWKLCPGEIHLWTGQSHRASCYFWGCRFVKMWLNAY